MTWKDFFDCPEEIFIGACLQFPVYFLIKWWAVPVMIACGLLWRAGGVTGGNKLFRRLGVPGVVCLSAFLVLHQWTIFLAVPFMVWLCPASYGKSSWLFKWILENVQDEKKADIITRGILFFWYWTAFFIVLMLCR